jgi:hypothetical protein
LKIRPPLSDDIGTQELRVDTGSLHAFGEFVLRELDVHMAPMADRVRPALTNGAIIGARLPSSDVEAMNATHALCLDQMALQLESYSANMAIIAEAAKAIAARYASSDALASASLVGTAPDLNAAIGQNSPDFPTTPHGGLV